jgi:hypothetical protein
MTDHDSKPDGTDTPHRSSLPERMGSFRVGLLSDDPEKAKRLSGTFVGGLFAATVRPRWPKPPKADASDPPEANESAPPGTEWRAPSDGG